MSEHNLIKQEIGPLHYIWNLKVSNVNESYTSIECRYDSTFSASALIILFLFLLKCF